MVGYVFHCSFAALWVGFLIHSAAAMEAVDFAEQIKPILENKCYRCHGDEKVKGELRLDSPNGILLGGETGEILVPGKPNESAIYLMTTYPEDDPDYMPQKGDGLNRLEQDLLKKWIEEGARFGEEVVMVSVPKVKPKFEKADPESELKYRIIGDAVDIVAKMKNEGLQVDTVNHDASQFEVSFTYAERDAGTFQLTDITDLAGSIVKLDFSRTNVSNEDLSDIGMFERIEYLDLSQTNLDDGALGYVGKLKSLRYLNLRDTNVTDEGILKLESLKSLERLYLWGTRVTSDGAEKLKQRLPETKVNLGADLEAAPRRANNRVY